LGAAAEGRHSVVLKHSLDLAYALAISQPVSNQVAILPFLSSLSGIRIFVDMVGIALFAAILVTPLYASMQTSIDPSKRGRLMSASTIMDAAILTTTSVVITVLFGLGVDVVDVLTVFGLANLAISLGCIALWFRDRPSQNT